MLVLGIILGFAIGFIFAFLCFRKLVIGTLKTMRDNYDGSIYPYIELDKPIAGRLSERKFVILKVDRSQQ